MRRIQNCPHFGCRINKLRVAAWFAMMQVFGLPHALANEPASMTQQQPAIPRTKSSKDFYYPDNAKRVGLEGTVLVEFNIDAKGKATGVTVIRADDPVFARAAKEFYSGLRFDVPRDWASSANISWRYRVGMVFCIPPSGQVDAFSETTYPPIIVTTNRIPGSPVRHPVEPGSSGSCAKPH
jgi:TonB family protein